MTTRSAEVMHGEAISELTRVLTAAGVAEPLPVAHDFVRWLVHEGWRPRSPRIETTTESGQVCPPTAVTEYQAAKAALRGGQDA